MDKITRCSVSFALQKWGWSLALIFGCLASAARADEFQGVIAQVALFSTRQSLWPDSIRSTPESPPTDSVVSRLRIAVLPVTVSGFFEKPVCDSCDRLTPNVLEFFLPAWHREILASWSRGDAFVISPEDPLLQADTAWLNRGRAYGLPWRTWFQPSDQTLIFRPRDRFTPDSVKNRLSSLGGKLGATHLFLIDSIQVEMRSWSRGSHHGSSRLSYVAAFWDVATGQPEWAVCLTTRQPWWSDLNAPLEPRLEPDWRLFQQHLPRRVRALLASEPR